MTIGGSVHVAFGCVLTADPYSFPYMALWVETIPNAKLHLRVCSNSYHSLDGVLIRYIDLSNYKEVSTRRAVTFDLHVKRPEEETSCIKSSGYEISLQGSMTWNQCHGYM
jgi:hypothetical protein